MKLRRLTQQIIIMLFSDNSKVKKRQQTLSSDVDSVDVDSDSDSDEDSELWLWKDIQHKGSFGHNYISRLEVIQSKCLDHMQKLTMDKSL